MALRCVVLYTCSWKGKRIPRFGIRLFERNAAYVATCDMTHSLLRPNGQAGICFTRSRGRIEKASGGGGHGRVRTRTVFRRYLLQANLNHSASKLRLHRFRPFALFALHRGQTDHGSKQPSAIPPQHRLLPITPSSSSPSSSSPRQTPRSHPATHTSPTFAWHSHGSSPDALASRNSQAPSAPSCTALCPFCQTPPLGRRRGSYSPYAGIFKGGSSSHARHGGAGTSSLRARPRGGSYRALPGRCRR